MSSARSYRLEVINNSDYVEYLKFIEDRWPEYKELREHLENNTKGQDVDQVPGLTGHVHVHDIISDNSLSSPLTFKAEGNSDIQFLKNTLLELSNGCKVSSNPC